MPGRMRDMKKKIVSTKILISYTVLFEILKAKDDYLDTTMIMHQK